MARFPSNFSSIAIELFSDRDRTKSKNDRQIYLSHRQSANRVKYLPVTFEIKCGKSGRKTGPFIFYICFQADEWLKGRMLDLLKSYEGPTNTDDISAGWNTLFMTVGRSEIK